MAVYLFVLIAFLCFNFTDEVKAVSTLEKNCGKPLLNKETDELDLRNIRNVPWAGFIVDESDLSTDIISSGSIISPTLFVTDANKFYDTTLSQFRFKKNYSLIYGSHEFNRTTSHGRKVKVAYISVHKKYSTKYGWYDTRNDFALVHLETPIQFNNHVHPACIPENKEYIEHFTNKENSTVFIFGWNKYKASLLFGIQVKTLGANSCESIWRRKFGNVDLGDRLCANVSQANEQLLCVTRPIGFFYIREGKFYIAGSLDNFYSIHASCPKGRTLHILRKISAETLQWFKHSDKCGPENFTCFSDGKCIPRTKLCDFKEDCADKSDEQAVYCKNPEMCGENEFRCQIYGRCVLKSKIMDGNADCPDGEDERDMRSSDQINTSLKIGLVVCVMIAFAALIVLVIYRFQIRSYKKQIRDLTEEELIAFYKGENTTEYSNYDSYFKYGDHSYKNLPSYINYINTGVLLEAWNDKYEISLTKLKIGDQIGQGNFGVVHKGSIVSRYVNLNTINTQIAVKIPKSDLDVEEFKHILREVKIMAHVGVHENVVGFVGACTEKIRTRNLYIVLEYCSKGSLLHHLRKQDKHRFVDKLNSSNDQDLIKPVASHYVTLDENTISTLDLLKWASQIANGMCHLENKNIIHGDLAARNVLLNGNLTAKISDFGLSRELNGSNIYVKCSLDPIPWKWMAVESFTQRVYSFKSDVWAYGVTLWEIFSLGAEPYGELPWSVAFVKGLVQGYRLPTPQFASNDIYKIMLETWNNDSEQRPSFSSLKARFATILAAFSHAKPNSTNELEVLSLESDFFVAYNNLE